ncbi:MAG TPA: hypothetical protein VN886_02895 [Acidimicrobiales bacterium]|nr:hypothetical protein [Acidimicrobiales bacterium]
MLRVDAIGHNTRLLCCGRVLERQRRHEQPSRRHHRPVLYRLGLRRVGFIADGLLDEPPASRVGGIDLNKAPTRNALAAVLALAASPAGFNAPSSPTRCEP